MYYSTSIPYCSVVTNFRIAVMETSLELPFSDQQWLDYLWDRERPTLSLQSDDLFFSFSSD